MKTEVITLYRACNNACRFCDVAPMLDRTPIGGGAIRAALDAAVDRGIGHVIFTGGEPTLSPHLHRAIAYAQARHLTTGIATHGRLLGDPEKLGRIVAAGLREAHVALHAVTPSVHNALVGGDPIAHSQTLAGLRASAQVFRTTLRTVLTRANADEIGPLVALAAELGVAFDLRALRHTGAAIQATDLHLTPDEALQAWRTAWQACQDHGVPFAHSGFAPVPRGAGTTPRPLDACTVAQLAAGLPDAQARAGLLPVDGVDLAPLAAHHRSEVTALPWVLALHGTPLLTGGPDRPAPLAPQDRVHVWADPCADAWMHTTVLPGLARALSATLHTPFAVPFDPDTLAVPPRPRRGAVTRLLRRAEEGPWSCLDEGLDLAALQLQHLAGLKLDGATVVIVPGFASARALRPRLPAGARLFVLDDGLAVGFDGTLGPTDRVISAHPGTARLYHLAGIPLDQVIWHPFPVVASQLQGDAGEPFAQAVSATRDLPPLSPRDGSTARLHALASALGRPGVDPGLDSGAHVPTVDHLAATLRTPRPAHHAFEHPDGAWWGWPA